VNVSPVLAAQATYPFVRIEQAKREAAANGIEIFDFGQGDPREPTDPLIQRALVEALGQTRGYPKADGLPELREAISAWIDRRFGVAVDAATEIVPTYGSKEAIFSFAQVVVDPVRGKDTVLVTEPGYPVPERGALFAGARVVHVPLREENGFLPELDALDGETLSRTAILWLNYPNNPTAAVAPLALFEQAAALAREHDFLLASDEAYSELWFGEPPPSALQVGDRSNVVVFNTLSKRSSMTGYRSGFVAGSRWVMDALRQYRPTVGTAPQEFVQRASVVAWGDEEHVARARGVYGRKREVLLGALDALGWRVAGSEATMYLWVEVPAGETSEELAARLLEHGVVVAPGAYLGPSGEGYVRLALVPTVEDCERAAAILRGLG
jgi:N-succinyldiaminopimelate aminotransferase